MSCSRKGVECEGYNLRWVGAAARGPMAGHTYAPGARAGGSSVARKRRTPGKAKLLRGNGTGRPENSQSKTASNTSSCKAHTHDADDTFASQQTGSRSLQNQDWSLSSIVSSEDIDGLVEYCRYRIHHVRIRPGLIHILDGRELDKAFYLGKDPVETPYARHIEPLTKSVSYIRYAVAALAACHLGNRANDAQAKTQSLHLRVKAIEMLRANLKSRNNGLDMECLAGMLLLTQLDVRVSLARCLRGIANNYGSYALEIVSNLERILKQQAQLSSLVALMEQSADLSNNV